MKRLLGIIIAMIMCATCTIAVADQVIQKTVTAPFFEQYEGSESISVHRLQVGTIKHRFLPKSNSAGNIYTGATDLGTTILLTNNAVNHEITRPDFEAKTTNQGLTLTVTFSRGYYTIYYYADWFTDLYGNRTPITDTLNHIGSTFDSSKTLNK